MAACLRFLNDVLRGAGTSDSRKRAFFDGRGMSRSIGAEAGIPRSSVVFVSAIRTAHLSYLLGMVKILGMGLAVLLKFSFLLERGFVARERTPWVTAVSLISLSVVQKSTINTQFCTLEQLSLILWLAKKYHTQANSVLFAISQMVKTKLE